MPTDLDIIRYLGERLRPISATAAYPSSLPTIYKQPKSFSVRLL
jgi:hypothetical protein